MNVSPCKYFSHIWSNSERAVTMYRISNISNDSNQFDILAPSQQLYKKHWVHHSIKLFSSNCTHSLFIHLNKIIIGCYEKNHILICKWGLSLNNACSRCRGKRRFYIDSDEYAFSIDSVYKSHVTRTCCSNISGANAPQHQVLKLVTEPSKLKEHHKAHFLLPWCILAETNNLAILTCFYTLVETHLLQWHEVSWTHERTVPFTTHKFYW